MVRRILFAAAIFVGCSTLFQSAAYAGGAWT